MYPFSSPQKIEKARKDTEKDNIELENIHKNTPLLTHHDDSQPCNHQRKIENGHFNKPNNCLGTLL